MPSAAVTRPRHVPARPLSGMAAHLGLPAPADDVLVRGITHASSEVCDGDVYVAMQGARTHGARYAADAAGHGAVALLTDPAGRALTTNLGLPTVVTPDPRALLGDAAAWVYGFPARDLTLYGVTGTNGKTTVTSLLHAVLGATAPAGLVGTIETRIGATTVPSVRTTPEASDLQALLAAMREQGVREVALEVSSHALALGRVGGLVVDVAGFTNLSQDHLDFHTDMQDYFAAKARLFTPQHARGGVVTVDDAWGRRLARQSGVPVRTLAAYADRPDDPAVLAADWRVLDSEPSGTGSRARLRDPDGVVHDLVVPLPGTVNVANAALAVALAHAGGVPVGTALRALARAPMVPGRMEVVGTDPLVVVDYAHSPDAIERALATLRATAKPPLVVVVGAGGDRDVTKRGPMGAAAAHGADLVVVTDDNPRSEDPASIRAAVAAGAAGVDPSRVLEVPDRAEAIAVAVARAGSGTVLVAGKGHEQGQEVGGVVQAFDDRTVARAVLAGREHRP